MSYDIKIDPQDEKVFLYIERRVAQSDLASAFGEMLPAAYSYAMAEGMTLKGPPCARYTEFAPPHITVQAGLPIAVAPTSVDHDEIKVGTLPSGDAAVTVHRGAYEGLSDAHKAVEAWIAEHGHTVSGPPWEVYLTDPSEFPNPVHWQTLVCWPVQSA